MMEKLIKAKEVAKALGIKYITLWTWIKKGKLKAFQPGGKYGDLYIKEKDLNAFLENN